MFHSLPVHSFARKTIRFSAGVGLCAGVGSCDSSPSSPNLEPGRVASIILVAGQDQSGVVGKELPASLEVRIVDADGHPVAGQIVNFKVVAGGGRVFAGTSLTSADGGAKERWTLGTSVADSQRVKICETPASQVATIVHHGEIINLKQEHAALQRWIENTPYQMAGAYREIYINRDATNGSEFATEIQYPVEKIVS